MESIGVILAGGRGARLKHLTDDLPKPMIDVAGKPILQRIIERLALPKYVIAVGYKHQHIISHFGDGSRFGCQIKYSIEQQPMGTGGALKLAHDRMLKFGWYSEQIIVSNGDSWLDVDIDILLTVHRWGHSSISIACVQVDNACEYGRVITTDDGRVVGFVEKVPNSSGLINGGVYVIDAHAFDSFPVGTCSFENDVLPSFVRCARVSAFDFYPAQLFDIGTNERLENARRFFGS